MGPVPGEVVRALPPQYFELRALWEQHRALKGENWALKGVRPRLGPALPARWSMRLRSKRPRSAVEESGLCQPGEARL